MTSVFLWNCGLIDFYGLTLWNCMIWKPYFVILLFNDFFSVVVICDETCISFTTKKSLINVNYLFKKTWFLQNQNWQDCENHHCCLFFYHHNRYFRFHKSQWSYLKLPVCSIHETKQVSFQNNFADDSMFSKRWSLVYKTSVIFFNKEISMIRNWWVKKFLRSTHFGSAVQVALGRKTIINSFFFKPRGLMSPETRCLISTEFCYSNIILALNFLNRERSFLLLCIASLE